jgi:hypothetical protein
MHRRPFLAVVCSVLLALTAGATRVRRLSLTEIRDGASSVLLVEVTGASTRVGQAKMVWTDYRVRVLEVLRGRQRAGDLVVLPFAGGRAGSVEAGIDGVPRLATGARYVIFADDAVARPVPAIGWGQGVFAVRADAGRQTLVSLASDRLELDSAGALMRARVPSVGAGAAGAPRRLGEPLAFNADGSPAPAGERKSAAAPANQAATLDDLRRFVRGSVVERADRSAR